MRVRTKHGSCARVVDEYGKFRTGPNSHKTVRCRFATIFGWWVVHNAPHTGSISPKLCTRSNKQRDRVLRSTPDVVNDNPVTGTVCEH